MSSHNREVEIIDMLISFFLMIIISTSPTVPTQPSPRFHVEAWVPFKRTINAWVVEDFGTKRNVKLACQKSLFVETGHNSKLDV